jgi:phage shock protein A
MNFLEWLRSLRRADRATAADIRRQLNTLRRRYDEMIAKRDALALDAVNSDTAAERWTALDDDARRLVRQIDVLAAALPQAEAHEAESARQAEGARREQAWVAYQRHIQEAQQSIDAVVANLPTGETLTALRDLRDRLAREARDLRTWSTDARVRRPLDPLNDVLEELQHRIDRVARARWAPSHPITLKRANTDAVAEAVARIERMGA